MSKSFKILAPILIFISITTSILIWFNLWPFKKEIKQWYVSEENQPQQFEQKAASSIAPEEKELSLIAERTHWNIEVEKNQSSRFK